MNNQKIVVMDYSAAEIVVISLEPRQYGEEEIEEILTTQYDYRMGDIYYMVVPEFKMRIE